MAATIIIRPENEVVSRVECADCADGLNVGASSSASHLRRVAETLALLHVCSLVRA